MSSQITKDLWFHDCNRCNHQWTSKTISPGTCANQKCRSPYWNKERITINKKQTDGLQTVVVKENKEKLEDNSQKNDNQLISQIALYMSNNMKLQRNEDIKRFYLRMNLTVQLDKYLRNRNLVLVSNSPDQKSIADQYRNVINFPMIGFNGKYPGQPVILLISLFESNSSKSLQMINIELQNIIPKAFENNKNLENLLTKCKHLCDDDPRDMFIQKLVTKKRNGKQICVVHSITFSKDISRSQTGFPMMELKNMLANEPETDFLYPVRAMTRLPLR